MSTLKYGLNITKKAAGSTSPKRKRLFDDDDEDNDAANLPPPPTKKAVNLSTRLTTKKHDEAALAADSTIYDYDASWDAQNALRQQKKAAEKAAAIERKPRYMDSLLASAEVRKRDQLRARDKQLQKEREAEGDDFADKESFVTGAYKEQQDEIRRAEEEERRKEEAEAKKGGGLNRLYRGLLDARESEHEAIVKAGKEGLKAVPDEDESERKKLEAKEGVIINEEGEVVDKRQLLTAGLNVQKKPKAAEAAKAAEHRRPEQNAFAGRNRMREGVRERQSRMLEAQLEEATRRAQQEEEEEQKKLAQTAQSKKTSTDVQSAKERYLARKKAAAEGK